MKLEEWIHIYYEDCFGYKHDGTILWFLKDGSFVVSSNSNTKMPQMDDSRRILKPSDEGRLFWFYPVPEYPVPIGEQMK